MYNIKEKTWQTQCRLCKQHKVEIYKVNARRITIKHDNTPDIENRIERMLIQLVIKNDLNVGIEPILNEELIKFGLTKSGNSRIWKNVMKFYICADCLEYQKKGYYFKLNDESQKHVYKCWLFEQKYFPKLKVFDCLFCKEKFSKKDITILQNREGLWDKFLVTRVFCSEACSNLWVLQNGQKT